MENVFVRYKFSNTKSKYFDVISPN